MEENYDLSWKKIKSEVFKRRETLKGEQNYPNIKTIILKITLFEI